MSATCPLLGAPRDQLALVEDREEDADVRVLVAAAVDVVVEETSPS
jgi:hypothetical protein